MVTETTGERGAHGSTCDGCLMLAQVERAERAEAAMQTLLAELHELADDFTENVDWSPGRNNYGDNEAWETAGKRLRAVLALVSR